MKRNGQILRSLLVAVLGSSGCEQRSAPPASAPPPPAPPAVATSGRAAPAAPAAPASGCRSLPWKDDESVGDATYEGRLDTLQAGVGNIVDNTFKLHLDRPVCLPAGGEEKQTDEIQVGGSDEIEARLPSLVGKTVVITGDGVKAFNAHHHRPIVISAKTLSVK